MEVRPVTLTRRKDDPLGAVRVGLGEYPGGFSYLSYRGDPLAVLALLRRMLAMAERALPVEPRPPQG